MVRLPLQTNNKVETQVKRNELQDTIFKPGKAFSKKKITRNKIQRTIYSKQFNNLYHIANIKKYDLEDRTLISSGKLIKLCKKINHNVINLNIVKKMLRTSFSICANFREANDSLGKNNYIIRLKITRLKETHTLYRLSLHTESGAVSEKKFKILPTETELLKNILYTIMNKTLNKICFNKDVSNLI